MLTQQIDQLLHMLSSQVERYSEAKKIFSSELVTCIWNSTDVCGFHIEKERDEYKELTIEFSRLEQLDLFNLEEISPEYIACLLWLQSNFSIPELPDLEGKIYTREGMIRRVLAERRERSRKSNYRVSVGNYFYGDHILYNDKNEKYTITLWDPSNYHGYINNIDWKTNKLATTKHIMFLCDYMQKHPEQFHQLPKESPYLELTLDPLHNYDLTWKYVGDMNDFQSSVVSNLFPNGQSHLPITHIASKVSFIRSLEDASGVVVRPEVYEKLSDYFDDLLLTQRKSTHGKIDFSDIKAELFPYQKEGVEFCLFKKAAIIADEMGLGKTLQAIATAVLKRKYLGFHKTLIICPASVKYQWKKEIEKFSDETALVVEGWPVERRDMYLDKEHYFFIVNYETVLRDFDYINTAKFDLIILDEAQKIKNYETKTANIISSLKKEHGLILTGTPIENKLIDLYSIILFLDKYKVTPLWDFSYQHCIFDKKQSNKINGYYNLNALKDRVSDLIVRRQKKDVLAQLPSVMQKDVFVTMTDEQASMHASFGRKLARILAKKFKTPFDWDEIMRQLTNMRRVSNSTFLIDKSSNYSSKLIELKHILINRLNIKETNKKVVIFSEWLDSLYLIEQLLLKEKIGFVKLTGSVAAKKRGELIKSFQSKEEIQVFLSTEAGGSGLNLQFADTLINFEIPWNPAKKNQRIGRIDRIGQQSEKLHIFNLICRDSIEIKIKYGLVVKQNLFDNVLNQDSNEDLVDFSNKGQAQFIKLLEDMLDFDDNGHLADHEEEATVERETILDVAAEPVSDQDYAATKNISGSKGHEYEKLEQVLSKGMEFLSGLFEMSTGEKLGGTEGHTIKVDKETGEVTLKFKLNI